MSKQNVLVIDDEVKMQRILQLMLQDMGHDVQCANNGKEALKIIEHEPVDLVITDLQMPVMDGIEFLKNMSESEQNLPAIVITAHGSVETAVEAMKHGAIDYITRPFEMETVELAVTRALNLAVMQMEIKYLRNELEHGWQKFIGKSREMRDLYHLIKQIAPSNSPVLVVGETGTGKELVAHAIHKASGRKGLFVPINCAAIPESMLESELFGHVKGAFTGAEREHIGKFEVSNGGTLFLDEITEMTSDLQAKLLRVLQENCIERLGSNRQIDLDLRVIATTNRNLEMAIKDGGLRDDLFFRLNVFRIDVPPLRERRDDIPLLIDYFLDKHAHRMGKQVPSVNREVVTKLCEYRWPGNVRELSNLVERILVLGYEDNIDMNLLPVEMISNSRTTISSTDTVTGRKLSLQVNVEELERKLIKDALDITENGKAKAARMLEISERSLWYKIKKYRLN